jgi:DNA mismatch repair protein MutS2
LTKPLPPLQKERSKWKTSQMLKEEERREEGKKMETINIKIKQKLESRLYDSNQKLFGKKR